MSKFNVGDEVRVTGESFIGLTGTVTVVEDGGCLVDHGPAYNPRIGGWHDDELELVGPVVALVERQKGK